MENSLINYFLRITTLKEEEINALNENIFVKRFTRGSFLRKEGRFNNDSYFVLNGLVRQFKMVDGKEVTTNFFKEDQWIICLAAFQEQTAAKHSLICAEDTTVAIANEQKLQYLFKNFPKFETISRRIIETAFREHQDVMDAYITDKPEQRYLRLLASRPDIFQRVPQYDIATYIGVKPESLSRIRKKLRFT